MAVAIPTRAAIGSTIREKLFHRTRLAGLKLAPAMAENLVPELAGGGAGVFRNSGSAGSSNFAGLGTLI